MSAMATSTDLHPHMNRKSKTRDREASAESRTSSPSQTVTSDPPAMQNAKSNLNSSSPTIKHDKLQRSNRQNIPQISTNENDHY